MVVGSCYKEDSMFGVRSERWEAATALQAAWRWKEEPVVLWASWLVERSAEAGLTEATLFQEEGGEEARGQAKGGVWTRARA